MELCCRVHLEELLADEGDLSSACGWRVVAVHLGSETAEELDQWLAATAAFEMGTAAVEKGLELASVTACKHGDFIFLGSVASSSGRTTT